MTLNQLLVIYTFCYTALNSFHVVHIWKFDVVCAFQVYLRPDVEDMTQVVDGVWRLPVSIVMRSASDGLMYELTDRWQLRRGQAWDEQVLLMTPLREVGPGWYSVFIVVPAADLPAAPAPDRLEELPDL